MTSTASKSAKTVKAAPPAEPIGDGWDDAPQVSAGESDAPSWVPHYRMFAAEVIAEKLALLEAGSTSDKAIIGELQVRRAFGEPRYFVLTSAGLLALPLHGMLTSALDCIDVKQKPAVRLEYSGEAPRSRPGERAAFMYDVRVKPAAALLSEPRAGALLPIHKENKANRDAAKKGARKVTPAEDDAG
jgi:hypothetical protein